MATELLTPDNVLIVLPNKTVWRAPIVNYTRMSTRRVDVGDSKMVPITVYVPIMVSTINALIMGAVVYLSRRQKD